MQFNEAIKNIIESFIAAWNSEDYQTVRKSLAKNIELKTEAINLESMQAPEINISGLDNAIDYWKEMKGSFAVNIEKYEIIRAGRNSEVLCHYKDIGLTTLVKVHIDEYGKATKIINQVNTL